VCSNPSIILAFAWSHGEKPKVMLARFPAVIRNEHISNTDLEHCRHFVPLGMTPYNLVDVYLHFGEIFCFCVQGRSVSRESEE
jgi:hypothetical protein